MEGPLIGAAVAIVSALIAFAFGYGKLQSELTAIRREVRGLKSEAKADARRDMEMARLRWELDMVVEWVLDLKDDRHFANNVFQTLIGYGFDLPARQDPKERRAELMARLSEYRDRAAATMRQPPRATEDDEGDSDA